MISFRSPEPFLQSLRRSGLLQNRTHAIPGVDLSAAYSAGHRA